MAGESSIIAVIKKGDKKDNKPEMATRQFDSFKELHDFQLNRLTRQIDMVSNSDSGLIFLFHTLSLYLSRDFSEIKF